MLTIISALIFKANHLRKCHLKSARGYNNEKSSDSFSNSISNVTPRFTITYQSFFLCCVVTYDKLLHFKKSAASVDMDHTRLKSEINSLVQNMNEEIMKWFTINITIWASSVTLQAHMVLFILYNRAAKHKYCAYCDITHGFYTW